MHTMKKLSSTILVFLLALCAQSIALQQPDHPPAPATPARPGNSLEGEWSGALDVQGQKLRLVLKVKKTPDGKLSGTIDSPDQGANDIPISLVEQSGDAVKLELAGIGAGYEGKMNASGSEITGQWKQGDGSLPLTLQRAGSRQAGKDAEPKGLPATLAGFEDEATFSLVLNEERLGVLQSTWKKDGSFESHATITLAGQTVKTSTTISPDADGRWSKIVMETPVATQTLTREGNSVTRVSKDKTTTWETRAGVLLFDNNAPILMSQAIRAYDRKKGGPQQFPVMIIPGVAMDVTLEAKETAD